MTLYTYLCTNCETTALRPGVCKCGRDKTPPGFSKEETTCPYCDGYKPPTDRMCDECWEDGRPDNPHHERER